MQMLNIIMDFKLFLIESDKNLLDINKTLAKLPKLHRDMVKGYKFVFQSGNTMKGDKKHVGIIDTTKKQIVLAAPWNYPREFTFLHEIAHLIWAKFVTNLQKEQWNKLVSPYKKKLDDTEEELFCMIYANCYAKNPVVKFDIKKLKSFVLKF